MTAEQEKKKLPQDVRESHVRTEKRREADNNVIT